MMYSAFMSNKQGSNIQPDVLPFLFGTSLLFHVGWRTGAPQTPTLFVCSLVGDQHVLAAVSEPVNRLISTCQQLYQHLSAA